MTRRIGSGFLRELLRAQRETHRIEWLAVRATDKSVRNACRKELRRRGMDPAYVKGLHP